MSTRSRFAAVLLLVSSFAVIAAKPPTPDQRAEELLSALKRGDFAAAYETFGKRMRDAVSVEQLKQGWNGQVSQLGQPVRWTVTAGPPTKGQELRFADIEMQWGHLEATITVDPNTGDVSGFFIKPMEPEESAKSQTKHAPYVDLKRFQDKPVTVKAVESFPLSGTITWPTEIGHVPGVVLVHGSGPQDLDETVGPNHVFKDLGEGLSSLGIAVLRYNKRTFQYKVKLSQMDPKSITLDDEVVNDAVAAVRTLKSIPGIDSTRVYVVGHSLGALLAPEIAVRSHAAGAVLLAPPGRPPWVIIAAQMKTMGASPAQIADVEAKGAKIENGTLGEETLLGLPQTYWRDWASRDGVAMVKKMSGPVLILRGDRDIQVEDSDIEVWRKGLAGMPNVEIATVPQLSHFLIAGSGKPTAAEIMVPGFVDQALVTRVATFVNEGGAKPKAH
ncbi:MAG TPA: alpha/beta fold hydrolase [Candidatus Eisenbacteria bacterium]|nr:alpha/beta fold hydrolase [Candidatus Eisenbacteria bacterium]